MLDQNTEDILSCYGELKGIMRGGTPPRSVDTLMQSAVERVNTDIDYFGIECSRPTASALNASNYIYYRCSGIFQTGSGSVALSMIGREERQAIEEAIRATKRAIADDTTLDTRQKEQAR